MSNGVKSGVDGGALRLQPCAVERKRSARPPQRALFAHSVDQLDARSPVVGQPPAQPEEGGAPVIRFDYTFLLRCLVNAV